MTKEKIIEIVNACVQYNANQGTWSIDNKFADEILAEIEAEKKKDKNGTLVKLPYKLGDLVWCKCWQPNDTYDIIPTTVDSYLIDEEGVYINMSSQFEKPMYINIDCVFATKAEAEKRLEELRGEV